MGFDENDLLVGHGRLIGTREITTTHSTQVNNAFAKRNFSRVFPGSIHYCIMACRYSACSLARCSRRAIIHTKHKPDALP